MIITFSKVRTITARVAANTVWNNAYQLIKHINTTKNDNAPQRRRLRRAAEREAENASENMEVIDKEVTAGNVQAEKATTIPVKNNKDIPANEHELLKDEVCSDESFGEVSDEILVEKILVTADCQADWNDKYVTKLVNEKLDIIGIRMKSIQVNRIIRKCFESCIITIEPTKKKTIEQESFPIRRWTMKCISW